MRSESTLLTAIWTAVVAIAMASAVFSEPDPMAGGQKEVVILAFGDSLTAGYLLPPAKSFPAQLEAALRAKGYKARVINSGVSGDTAEDGLARLDWSLSEKADAVIVEFGGNDALRGTEPDIAGRALDGILQRFREEHYEILIAGMESPRNWGPEYSARFRAMYPRLAEKHGAGLYPFLLKDVAQVPSLNLKDGIHPTPEGVAIIVRNILPDVERLIARVREKTTRRQG